MKEKPSTFQWTLSVAPMMTWTDRHDRYLLRLITKHTRLYTEMISCDALRHGNQQRLLRFHPNEHPVALQLGGSEPKQLAECAKMGYDRGYDEINMNVGCPSDRVQSGRFGACLMAEPERVAQCVAAMRNAVPIPISVKTRIGIDHQDSYEALHRFVRYQREAGCEVLIVHARKAWLKGLSPRQNRSIPPLRYEVVHRLKEDFPDLQIVINGGIRHLPDAQTHLQGEAALTGVMIGREAYHNPFLLIEADGQFYGDTQPQPTRLEVLAAYCDYMEEELAQGTRLAHLARHLLGLFQGQPGARAWRRHLSEWIHRRGVGIEVLDQALAKMRIATLPAYPEPPTAKSTVS